MEPRDEKAEIMNSSTNCDPSRRRVRVLDGPLRGACHVMEGCFTMGRAGTSDLQLLDEGVSREHAQIRETPQGTHVLVDLSTTNGTYVDNRRVANEVLEPGTVFSILATRFIYEELEPVEPDCEDSGVFAVRYHGAPSRRGTIEYVVGSVPGLADDEQPELRELSLAAASWDRPDCSVTAIQTGSEELHRISAKHGDGSAYEGSLIDDVVDYRHARVQMSRDHADDLVLRRQVQKLEERLCLPALPARGLPPARRTYQRFSCYFPAGLRRARGVAIAGVVLDFGVDGAQVLSYRHEVVEDTIIWLAVDVVSKRRAQTLVFPSRVAWTSRDHLGLNFSSQPEWRPPAEVDPRAPTRVDFGTYQRPARPRLSVVGSRARAVDE